jgi:hypothetical protein
MLVFRYELVPYSKGYGGQTEWVLMRVEKREFNMRVLLTLVSQSNENKSWLDVTARVAKLSSSKFEPT